MLHRIAERIAAALLRQADQDAEDLEVYTYGVECLLADALQVLLLALVALIANAWGETLCFAVTFAAVKSNTGGYHARTHLGCMAMLTATSVAQIVLCRVLAGSAAPPVALIATVLASALIAALAPIAHPHHPQTVERQRKARRACVVAACCMPVLCIAALLLLPRAVWQPASFGALAAALTLPTAKGGDTAWKRS